MNVELPHVLSLVGLVTGLVSLATSLREKQRTRDGDFERRLALVTNDVEVLKVQMLVFWKDVALHAAKILHSPHTPILDSLIQKFQDGRLSPEESAEMMTILMSMSIDPQESAFRQKVALAYMEEVRADAAQAEQRRAHAPGRLEPEQPAPDPPPAEAPAPAKAPSR